MIDDRKIKEVKSLKYLGEYLGSDLKESVHITVTKITGLLKHAVFELRTVMEDTRAETVGAMNVTFDIWNLAVPPFLLDGSENFTNLSKKTLKMITDSFNNFFRIIFQI